MSIYTPLPRAAAASAHLAALRTYIERLKSLQEEMDPLIATDSAIFCTQLQWKSIEIVARAKIAMASMEHITELSKDLRARMVKAQVCKWVCLVNEVENEWMATVECVRKLELARDGCVVSEEHTEGRLMSR